MSVTVQIVFSGLIMMASDQPMVGKHSALLVDDEHFAAVFLLRGTASCQPVRHSRGCLIWELEWGDPWEVYLGKTTQRSAQRMVGRSEHNGKPVAVPKVPLDVEDTEWMPDLSELVGPYGLDEGCKTGAGVGCGRGVAARFVVPGGRLKTCHLAHLHEQESKVLLAHFPNSSIPPRAISNAFLNTVQLTGDKVQLCRKRSSGSPECVEIEPDEGVVRLLVRNEQGNLCDQVEDAVEYGPHSHFSHFYPMLATNEIGPIPHLNDELAIEGPNEGECEEDLAEGDDIVDQQPDFVTALRLAWNAWLAGPRSTDFFRDGIDSSAEAGGVTLADLIFYCMKSWPHSTAQCDNSTYP